MNTVKFSHNDAGKMVKTTRCTRIVAQARRFHSAVERRSRLSHFGRAVNQSSRYVADGGTTTQSRDEVRIEKPLRERREITTSISKKVSNDGGNITGLGNHCHTFQGFVDKYVPPSLHAGNAKIQPDTLKVTNISTEVSDEELEKLFKPFGPLVRRVKLVRSTARYDSLGRAFGDAAWAYVQFIRIEDGQKAIETLEGFGFHYMRMHLEWTKSRSW